jgi:integrase
MKRIPHFHEKRGTNKSGAEWVAYYHVAKIHGKVKWTALGTNRVEALRKWADLEKRPAPAETGTFNSIADLYADWMKVEVAGKRLAARTLDDRETYLKTQLRPVFGPYPFEAITSLAVRTYIDKRTAKISAKKEMRFLSVLWNWAKERGYVSATNPVSGVKMPKEKGRDIEVTPQDYWLVHGCGDQLVKDVLELAARLGTRPQEAFNLTWDQVAMGSDPITVKVYQNKVDAPRTVEADAELAAMLKRLRGDRTRPAGHVLTEGDGEPLNPVGAFRYRFSAARKAAIKKAKELDVLHQDFQLRDLRPMAGLAMMDAEGMDAARRLLGHATERMTAHYTTKRRGMVSRSATLVRSTSNLSQDITGEDSVSA